MKRRLAVFTVTAFVSGIALIFFSAWAESFYAVGAGSGVQASAHAFNMGTLGDTLLAIIKGLGMALITSTSISLLKLFIESPETLTNYGFVNLLSKEELEKLKSEIQSILYFKKINFSNDNFYNFFERELSSLLDQCYYEHYTSLVSCRIHEDYITKTIVTKFKLVNPSKKQIKDTIPFEAEMQKVAGFDLNQLYRINRFVINSEDCTEGIRERLKITDKGEKCNDAYCVKISTSWEFTVKEYCNVEIETETVVPINDVCYSNQVTKPCKRYNIVFTINDPSYKISWYNFGYMRKDNKEEYKERVFAEPLDNGLTLGFNSWILPGDGAVIAIGKNGK